MGQLVRYQELEFRMNLDEFYRIRKKCLLFLKKTVPLMSSGCIWYCIIPNYMRGGRAATAHAAHERVARFQEKIDPF